MNRRRGHGIAVAGLVDDDAQNLRAGAVLASAPAYDLPKLAATGTALTNSAVTAASIGIAPALDSRTNAIATGSRPIERRSHD